MVQIIENGKIRAFGSTSWLLPLDIITINQLTTLTIIDTVIYILRDIEIIKSCIDKIFNKLASISLLTWTAYSLGLTLITGFLCKNWVLFFTAIFSATCLSATVTLCSNWLSEIVNAFSHPEYLYSKNTNNG